MIVAAGCAVSSPAQSMDLVSGLFGDGADKPAEAQDVVAADQGSGGGEDAEAATDSGEDGHYIQVDALTAPVIVRQRVRHHILLTLSIEVPRVSDKNQVARVMPRLRDAMLRDLYAAPIVREEDSGHLDLESLRERMLAVARQTVGTDIIKDVLVVRAMRSS
jgi:hypothetical protein